MKILSLFMLLFSLHLVSYAQIDVVSLKKLADSDARVGGTVKRDQNGEKCAIIKVSVKGDGYSFEGDANGIVALTKQTGEYWVYVPYGSKRLTIKHNQHGVKRYTYKLPISKATCYELKLVTAEVTTVVRKKASSNFISIISEPDDAEVYIDDELVGSTPFNKRYKAGSYSLRVEKDLYKPYIEAIQHNADKKIRKDIKLKENFGSLTVSTGDLEDAEVWIDGKKQDQRTPFTIDRLEVGTYKIKIRKKDYKVATKNAQVKVGAQTASFELKPNFAQVRISSPENLMIYLDDDPISEGAWEGRLSAGIHTIETKDPRYYNELQEITILPNQDQEISLNPTPKLGILSIESKPSDASIYIDGKKLEERTPAIVNSILVGKHKIRLSKEGYHDFTKTISVKENKEKEIKWALKKDLGPTISVNTDYDSKIFVDGKYVGNNSLIDYRVDENHTYTVAAVAECSGEKYQATKEITLKANQHETVSLKLNAQIQEAIEIAELENMENSKIDLTGEVFSVFAMFSGEKISALTEFTARYNLLETGIMEYHIPGLVSFRAINKRLFLQVDVLSKLMLSEFHGRFNYAGAGLGFVLFAEPVSTHILQLNFNAEGVLYDSFRTFIDEKGKEPSNNTQQSDVNSEQKTVGHFSVCYSYTKSFHKHFRINLKLGASYLIKDEKWFGIKPQFSIDNYESNAYPLNEWAPFISLGIGI